MAYELLATVEVGGSGAGSIAFESLPNDGTDLIILFSLRKDTSGFANLQIRFNNDSGSNYSTQNLSGSGTAVASQRDASTEALIFKAVPGSDSTAATFGGGQLSLPNYANSLIKYAYVDNVNENNDVEAYQTQSAIKYNSTSPISAVEFFTNSPDLFAQFSSVSIYRVTSGNDGTTVVS